MYLQSFHFKIKLELQTHLKSMQPCWYPAYIYHVSSGVLRSFSQWYSRAASSSGEWVYPGIWGGALPQEEALYLAVNTTIKTVFWAAEMAQWVKAPVVHTWGPEFKSPAHMKSQKGLLHSIITDRREEALWHLLVNQSNWKHELQIPRGSVSRK